MNSMIPAVRRSWLAWMLAAGLASAATPEWVHEAVCPMVGPFTKDSGPQGKTLEQILTDFRPEIAEWSALPSLKGNPLCPKSINWSLEYQEFPQDQDRDFKMWQAQFGSQWEPTEDCGVAVPSSGKVSSWKYGSEDKNSLWFVCHNAPKWHSFHKESILRTARDPSCALIRQDNIAGPSGVLGDNGGWCKWCLAGFKDRLGQRFTAVQLGQLGVADLGAFDPGVFLRTLLRANQAETNAMVENPLVREYTRFMQKSNLDLWRDEVDGAHAIRADVPVCGNQGSGDMAAYPTVLLSDVSDLIFLENSRRTYPDNSSTISYALALAGGRHAKPAWIWGFGTPEQMEQVDGSRLFVAECYASGATPYYEMNNLGYSAQKGYHAIALGTTAYEALAGYARFAREHRALLTRGYAAEAQVALLYSVPSFVPKCCGALNIGRQLLRDQADHLLGFARFCEHRHIPYNVEVLGDDELWPDRDLAARLARYAVVVCPNVEAFSNAQAAALRQFTDRGGRLIASGDFGARDEGFAKRPIPALAELRGEAGKGKAFWLKDEPVAYLRSHAVQASRGASQKIELNQAAAKPLVVRGWSKCQDVSGASDGEYSVWLDLTYTDGTPLWAQVAKFRTGTHDWEQAEFVIHPQGPLKAATVHALFRHHSGTVWFDDLFVGEEGGPNLLKNPGLEGGDGKSVPEWDPYPLYEGGYGTDTQAHSGTGAIRCEIARPTGESPAAATLAQTFAEALPAGIRQIETDAPSTVFIRPVRHGDRLVIHLLNLDYDGGKDAAKPVGKFRLAVRFPAESAGLTGAVMLATPDAPGPDAVLPHRAVDGRIEVIVPQLRVWSVVDLPAPGR